MSHGGREQCAALLLAAREQGQLRPRRAAATELASGYAVDLAHPLSRWVERDGLDCASSVYCPLPGSTRSTIAAAFSPCGCLLASTQCVQRAARRGACAPLVAHLPPALAFLRCTVATTLSS